MSTYFFTSEFTLRSGSTDWVGGCLCSYSHYNVDEPAFMLGGLYRAPQEPEKGAKEAVEAAEVVLN